jgi:hypothetical protein
MVAVCGSVAALAWAERGDDASSPGTQPRPGADQPVYEFVGSKTCRKCHTPQHQSWEESPHAEAWDDLLPGHGAKAKSRSGLDPQADYQADARCLKCHAVGFGQPGGYAVPAADDGRAQRLAASRQGVGCESCHGPGSGFVEVMEEVNETHRRYHPQEVRKLGRMTVTQSVCLSCHNKDAICMVGEMADDPQAAWSGVDVADREGSHSKTPYRFREPESSSESAVESKERFNEE